MQILRAGFYNQPYMHEIYQGDIYAGKALCLFTPGGWY